jgi:hypothetical protein
LSLRALRADALRRLLLSERGASAVTVEDVEALPDLASWSRLVLDVAIADLVHNGLLVDDEHGRVHVQPIEVRWSV